MGNTTGVSFAFFTASIIALIAYSFDDKFKLSNKVNIGNLAKCLIYSKMIKNIF